MIKPGLKVLGNILENEKLREISLRQSFFPKLSKRKVQFNVVLTSHVLLICLKSMLHYELNYPDTNMLSHTLI